jgi:chorismate dehydratase
MMIRLGHIEYSNCFPVHALLLTRMPADNPVEIVTGTPSELNSALAAGAIDVAPSSSIEYARHSERYRLLPDFVIGSDGPVGSIRFETLRPIAELNDATIAVPTASATSVVLLKILLRLKYGINARFQWFDQVATKEPLTGDTAAALWIGDVALRRSIPAGRAVYDLGAEWKEWTGLPFVFAAWQTSAPAARDGELGDLLALLHESRAYFNDNAAQLAQTYAEHFRIAPARLLDYWLSLRYAFDERMQKGLLEYYRLAAQLGEAPAVARLNWVR